MNDTPTHIAQLLHLLGHCVFLKWPLGKKGDQRRWRHLTPANMTPEYLASLTDCNIGIALGKVSHGLCAIDLDSDELIQPFRDANPWTEHTTITRGARGCQVWVRIVGDYPTSATLQRCEVKCGEWRADGNQSIVPPSIHPVTGQPYTFITDLPVAQVPYNEIRYPDGMTGPSLSTVSITTHPPSTDQHTPTPIHTTELCGSKLSPEAGDETCSSILSANSVEEPCSSNLSPKPVSEKRLPDYHLLVSPHFATAGGNNHQHLFALAQAVHLARLQAYSVDTRRVFALWWQESHPYTRRTLNADTYWDEFQQALTDVKGDRLSKAWQDSATIVAPGAEAYCDPQMKRLAALCYCLRDEKGDFFLSCRAAGRLLGIPHDDANRWLGSLVNRGILADLEKGSLKTGKATRFRYVGKPTDTTPWDVDLSPASAPNSNNDQPGF